MDGSKFTRYSSRDHRQGAKTIFFEKKGDEDFFSKKNEGADTFLTLKKNGAKTFFTLIYPPNPDLGNR